jgi:hypothetical protein
VDFSIAGGRRRHGTKCKLTRTGSTIHKEKDIKKRKGSGSKNKNKRF